jgi:hypothetical protein
MKADTRFSLTPHQEQIAAEIANVLGEWLQYPRSVVLDRIRNCIATLTHMLPEAQTFFNRRENKAHAKKLIRAIDTLKQLIKTAPKGLAWSFLLHPDDPFYMQLDRMRKTCTRQSPCPKYGRWHDGLIGPEFGHHHNYGLAKQWCAEFAVMVMQEVAPGARISSSSSKSLFRQVTALLYGAVMGLDLESARGADLARACRAMIGRIRRIGTNQPP